MAKISVIGGVSDKNAPAPLAVVAEPGPEPIQVEDILAGAVKPAPEPTAKAAAKKTTAKGH